MKEISKQKMMEAIGRAFRNEYSTITVKVGIEHNDEYMLVLEGEGFTLRIYREGGAPRVTNRVKSEGYTYITCTRMELETLSGKYVYKTDKEYTYKFRIDIPEKELREE